MNFLDRIVAWCKKHPFLALLIFFSLFNNNDSFFNHNDDSLT